VDDDSEVETFVAIEAYVDNDRWRDVPFYLRTGKKLARSDRVITLRFRPSESTIFDGDTDCNDLVLELSDDPVIHVDLLAKRPGPVLSLVPATMTLDVGDEAPEDEPLEAYERLLLDVLRGDRTLFTRSDEVDRLWQVCQPVLDAPPEPLPYEPGSWGPQKALDLPEGGWRLHD
jgi:glucose-6-phosphate 1-dehydrogenase